MMRAMLPALLACVLAAAPARAASPPPANAGFDYQIGGDYPLPPGVRVVSRDWFNGAAPAGAYGICYVNAFQTQADEAACRPRRAVQLAAQPRAHRARRRPELGWRVPRSTLRRQRSASARRTGSSR